MNESGSERPAGARPQSERSDWTEQDLLTVEEALPRLLDAIEDAAAEAAAASDPGERELLDRRLAAMHRVRERLEGRRDERGRRP